MPGRRGGQEGQPLVRAGALRLFEQWLGQPGWLREGTALAGTADPLPALIGDADERRMLENLVANGAAEPLLRRLLLAPQLPLSAPMQAALAVSPTLGEALGFMIESLARSDPRVAAGMAADPGSGLVLRLGSDLEGDAGAFAACYAGLVLLRLVEAQAFERLSEVTLALPEGPARLLAPLAGLLRCRQVERDGAVEVRVPSALAALPNPAGDPALWGLYRDQARARQRWGQSSPVAALKALLAQTLREERLVLRRREAARRLGLADRTLSRLLADAGTGFAELLAAERRALAGELLLDPSLSLQLIADRLGFPDASTFGRAFRAWHGESPGRFRQRLMMHAT